MLIKADAGDNITPGTGVPGNDKVTIADFDSSKMESVVGRVNIVTLELKMIAIVSIIPNNTEIVVHKVMLGNKIYCR